MALQVEKAALFDVTDFTLTCSQDVLIKEANVSYGQKKWGEW